MTRYLLIIANIFLLQSCVEGLEKKEFTISGQLIDSTQNRNWDSYDITARSIQGSSESELTTSSININGTFKLTYYAEEVNFSKNIRLVVYPYINAQYKLEYLPFSESWNKIFYVGDSARVHFKLNKKLAPTQTLYLQLDNKNIVKAGPDNSLTIGTYRLLNKVITLSYYIDSKANIKYLNYEPTGDPVVDTLTLDMNP